MRRVQQQLSDAGHAYTRVELGVMIEIPAAAVMLPMLLGVARRFDGYAAS